MKRFFLGLMLGAFLLSTYSCLTTVVIDPHKKPTPPPHHERQDPHHRSGHSHW